MEHFKLLQSSLLQTSMDGLPSISFIDIILICIMLFIVFKIVFTAFKETTLDLTHWHHHFETLQYSSQEFYKTIEANLTQKGIPDLLMYRIQYSEGGAFSANREYLRIARNRLFFDVCAAPFGRGFFISWWQGETPNPNKQLLVSIPFIGKPLAEFIYPKTYYQIDTAQMFRESIEQLVMEVVDAITEFKGIRALSNSERQYNGVKLLQTK